MSDYDYEATVETEDGTFTFRGDDPRVVSAQAARLPVTMHSQQVQDRIDLTTPVEKYLEQIAEQEQVEKKKNAYKNRYARD
jgi:hypothetical protein